MLRMQKINGIIHVNAKIYHIGFLYDIVTLVIHSNEDLGIHVLCIVHNKFKKKSI